MLTVTCYTKCCGINILASISSSVQNEFWYFVTNELTLEDNINAVSLMNFAY